MDARNHAGPQENSFNSHRRMTPLSNWIDAAAALTRRFSAVVELRRSRRW
jgi:hypothetical protein